MDVNEVTAETSITAAYRWNAEECLKSYAWASQPDYKNGGKGLFQWAIGLLLAAFLVTTFLVIWITYMRSPGSLLGREFWKELFLGWVESSGSFARLVGLFVLVFGGVWIMLRYVSPWLQRRRMRQYFSKNPGAETDVRVTIDAQTLAWEIGDATQTINKWKVYSKVVKAPEGFLFFLGSNYSWLPAHAFASGQDIARLSQLARQNALAYEEIA